MMPTIAMIMRSWGTRKRTIFRWSKPKQKQSKVKPFYCSVAQAVSVRHGGARNSEVIPPSSSLLLFLAPRLTALWLPISRNRGPMFVSFFLHTRFASFLRVVCCGERSSSWAGSSIVTRFAVWATEASTCSCERNPVFGFCVSCVCPSSCLDDYFVGSF